MKRFFFSLLVSALIPCLPLRAQQLPTLDSSAFISIITCGPGNEFFTSFGHSAIRVCDSVQGIDVIYNYGTFDFNTPHFYLKFSLGRLNYCLSRQSYPSFMMDYGIEGRSVHQQILRLSFQERQNLFVLLETNYLPEYRYYPYDLFRDNCATRVRDVVANALVHRTLFVPQSPSNAKTYRQILYDHTAGNLMWWQFGVDIVLGANCDRPCSNMQYMFAPIELMRQFDTARLSDTRLPLAQPATQLLPNFFQPTPTSFSPLLAFWLLFAAVVLLSLLGWWRKWSLAWLDVLLFVAVFAVSLVVIYLWFISDHYCTKWNWNLLWASPLFLYFAIARRRSKHWVIVLQLLAFLALIPLTLCGVQSFNAALLPIVLLLALRLCYLAALGPKHQIFSHCK